LKASPLYVKGKKQCQDLFDDDLHLGYEIRRLAPNIRLALRESVAHGVSLVFWASVITALLCLLFRYGLPKEMDHSK
jgi:hypothetical protein